jgi:hypothetical protein
MREFIEDQYGVQVLRWDEPTEDGTVFEVIHQGRVIRADTLALILSAVQEVAVKPLRLAWTNVIAGTIVMPMRVAA